MKNRRVIRISAASRFLLILQRPSSGLSTQDSGL
jgi:hypothetical protein